LINCAFVASLYKQIVIKAQALILQYPTKVFQWKFGNFEARALAIK